MPVNLATTINKIKTFQNPTNAEIIDQFYHYMKRSDVFYDIKNREQITAFLDTKVKNREEDPDKRWITTWYHYLNRIRLFFR